MIVFSFFCSPFNRARRAFRIIEKRAAAWCSLLPFICSPFDISISFLLFGWGSSTVVAPIIRTDADRDMGRIFRDFDCCLLCWTSSEAPLF